MHFEMLLIQELALELAQAQRGVIVKIYIAADIEGIAGVVNPGQTMPGGGADYERSRTLMAGEVNSAVEAAFEAGATKVVVNDAHGPNTNLRPEDLHPEVELLTGKPKPFNMVHGVDEGFDALIFVGYHARAGTRHAIIDHTYFSTAADIRVNGIQYGEFGLNTMLAGHFGVPAVFASGDDKFVDEARALVPNIEGVVVKRAVSRTAAMTLMPARARSLVGAGVGKALNRVRDGAVQPFKPPVGDLLLEVSYLFSGQADYAELLPGAARSGARTVQYSSGSYPDLFSACRALLLLGAAT